MGSRNNIFKIRVILAITGLIAVFSWSSSYSAVLAIDSFGDGFQLGVFDPLSATIVTENSFSGERFIQKSIAASVIDRTAVFLPSGPIPAIRFNTAIGSTQPATFNLVYGGLDLDLTKFYEQGEQIFLRAFASTDGDAAGHLLWVTITDGVNSFQTSQSVVEGGSFVSFSLAEATDFGVDIENITELRFSAFNLPVGGEMTFGLLRVGQIPEPGTIALMSLAFGMIMLLRRRTRVTPEPVPVRVSGPFTMMNSMSSSSDLYSLPNRSF